MRSLHAVPIAPSPPMDDPDAPRNCTCPACKYEPLPYAYMALPIFLAIITLGVIIRAIVWAVRQDAKAASQ